MIRTEIDSMPSELDDLRRRIMQMEIEEMALKKEDDQLSRDRLTFGLIVGIPMMQMLLFGYAINFDVRDLKAAVVDEALLPNIPPYTRGRLLRRQDLDSETEIAAESLADRLAAGIRGSVFAESAYSEVFG